MQGATAIVAAHIASLLAALGLNEHLGRLYAAVNRWNKDKFDLQGGTAPIEELPLPNLTAIAGSHITCKFEKPFVDLVSGFIVANNVHEAFKVLRKTDSELDVWNKNRQPDVQGQATLSCGVVFHFPGSMFQTPHGPSRFEASLSDENH